MKAEHIEMLENEPNVKILSSSGRWQIHWESGRLGKYTWYRFANGNTTSCPFPEEAHISTAFDWLLAQKAEDR